MIRLGTCADGRVLSYDATLYEFRLQRDLVSYADVRNLDDHAHINWCAPEQRDWFRKINPVDLDRCNRRALGRHGNGYESLSPEEQVQRDAKRDDSVLAGKIVDADPALVRAVADALEAQGLVGRSAGGSSQMVIGMPQGMESLSQLQKTEGRKMTLMEHYLMRQILKNDDKEKAKRERRAASLEAHEAAKARKEEHDLENTRNIARAQKRVMNVDAREARSIQRRSAERVRAEAAYDGAVRDGADDSIDSALSRAEAATAARFREQPGVQFDDEWSTDAYGRTATNPGRRGSRVEYTDSYGRPIRPEADAMRPDMSQSAYVQSDEDKALAEMRARNLAQQSYYESTDVPGMEAAGKGRGARRGINDGASINGHAVNADGTRKDTAFTKFMGGLGKFNEAISPLVGGGHGGGGVPGMGGGQGGGGGMGMGGGSGMGGGGMGMGGGSGMGGGRM